MKGVLAIGKQLVRHVLPGVVKPLRVLWNEIIGFVFLVLAVISGPSVYRSVRDLEAEDAGSFFRMILSVLFVLIMVGFGVSSFMRARRISRSS
jgi:hypothetical protein